MENLACKRDVLFKKKIKKSSPEENQNDIEVILRCRFIIPEAEVKF